MEPFQTNKLQQQEALKKNSLLLLQLEKQKQSTQQPLFQDTNYIGITINDDLPKQTYNNANTSPNNINNNAVHTSGSYSGNNRSGLTGHKSLSHISTTNTNKTTNNNTHARHASFSYTTNNNGNSYHSPRLQQSQNAFSPRFNQAPLFEEAQEETNYTQKHKVEEDSYMIQSDKSGAFRKIKSQADLPMSHHRRAREGKRYGVSFIEFLCVLKRFIHIPLAIVYAYI